MRHFEHFFLNFRRLTLINLGHSTLVYTAPFYGLGLVQSLAWRNHKRCKKARFCIRLLKVLGHGVELFFNHLALGNDLNKGGFTTIVMQIV